MQRVLAVQVLRMDSHHQHAAWHLRFEARLLLLALHAEFLPVFRSRPLWKFVVMLSQLRKTHTPRSDSKTFTTQKHPSTSLPPGRLRIQSMDMFVAYVCVCVCVCWLCVGVCMCEKDGSERAGRMGWGQTRCMVRVGRLLSRAERGERPYGSQIRRRVRRRATCDTEISGPQLRYATSPA